MPSDTFERVRSKRTRPHMKPDPVWLYQLKKLVPTLFIVYTLTFSLLFAAVTIHMQTKIHISDLTQNPAAMTGAPFYAGLLSNVGILLWSFSAAICLFCSAVLRKDTNNREFPLFLLFSGIITSVLLMDDLFLFHEKVYPDYLNIPEEAVYTAYSVIILFYLIRFRMVIIGTDFLLLLFAFGFFGLSLVFDRGLVYLPFSHYLLGDGAKLFGIVSWFTYFTRIGLKRVKYAIMFRQQGLAGD